jgi:hypothetical protein
MPLELKFPGDVEILEYDMDRLLANIEQMHANIQAFQKAISDEQARISLYGAIIDRKRKLEEQQSEEP